MFPSFLNLFESKKVTVLLYIKHCGSVEVSSLSVVQSDGSLQLQGSMDKIQPSAWRHQCRTNEQLAGHVRPCVSQQIRFFAGLWSR